VDIKKYKDYLFENEINLKELEIFFSEELSSLLKTLSSPIAKDLLNLASSNEKFAFSYIDLTEDIETVSVLPVNRLSRIKGITEDDLEYPTPDSPLWGPYGRQLMRIGTLVARTLPKYAGSKELENFVHQFKSKLDVDNYTLKIVDGEELRKYYHVKTYYNPTPGITEKPPDGEPDPRTVLMKSCLKQPEKQDFFDIYVENPDSVKLLIMLNKKGELVARALIWYNVFVVDDPANPTKGTLLDRIYYTNESDVNIFIDYAKKNGWCYKLHQVKDCITFVFNGKVVEKPITTRLAKHGLFKKYPYIDTLCFYTPNTGRISTSRGRPAKNPNTGEIMLRLQLQKTNGGFKKLRESN